MELPSVIRGNEFTDSGLVRKDNMLYVPAYVASQLGFSHPGKHFLEKEFYPNLKDIGILPLCPFNACAEFLDPIVFDENVSVRGNREHWRKFNKLVGEINYGTLMPHSLMMIALFDGGHAVDDGVAAEIGHYASEYTGRPIVGIRSDFRLAENIDAVINPAVSHFITSSEEHRLFSGLNAYGDALDFINNVVGEIIKDRE